MKKTGIRIALLLLLAVAAALAGPRVFEPKPGPPARTKTVSSGAVSGGSAPGLPNRPDGEISSGGAGSSSAAPSPAGSSPAGNSILSESRPPSAAPPPSSPKPVRMPEASGTRVFSQNGAAVDYSNSSQGYVMVRYSGSAKMKVLVYYNGGSSYYQYDIAGNGAYQTLPLQSGSGSYRIRFMQNLSGSMYAELCSTAISVSVGGAGCYLYPNQYVNYSGSSAAVREAQSLCANSGSSSQKVDAISRYIASNIKYDSQKANSVAAGYLPNVDATLAARKGICFDYAALMAAMCRSQDIPTRLVIGNTSYGYHAWDEVYLNGWVRYDPTFAAAGRTAGTYTPQKYY